MRVLIADDEPLALTALANILRKRRDVENFDSASDGIEAQRMLSNASYDVVLLDINMPELSGIELVDQLQHAGKPMPSIVFVTAHHQHAIAAFDKHAVDYVLKPFTEERIHQALDGALKRTEGERASQLLQASLSLRSLRPESSRIAIKAQGRILFIDSAEVISVHAQGNYVLLRKDSGSYLLRESISDVAEKLRPFGFIRIHRSILVNSAFVEELRPSVTGDYELRLKGGKEYTVTRTYKKNVRHLAQFWVGTDSFLAK